MAKTATTPQTSNKSGVASTSKKLDNSRHGFDTHPASRQQGGAFAQEGKPLQRRKPGTASTREGKASALRRIK
jgi:hypothetical protein